MEFSTPRSGVILEWYSTWLSAECKLEWSGKTALLGTSLQHAEYKMEWIVEVLFHSIFYYALHKEFVPEF